MGAAKTMTDDQGLVFEPTVSCKRFNASGQVRSIQDASCRRLARDEGLDCGTVGAWNPETAIHSERNRHAEN